MAGGGKGELVDSAIRAHNRSEAARVYAVLGKELGFSESPAELDHRVMIDEAARGE